MHRLAFIILIVSLCAGPALTADWPHWGGGLGRNMVNPDEKNLPTTWDVKSGQNIKWVARLGSLAYGNPVVADGRVFVGTNNGGRYDKAITGDRGNILCFRETDGAFLWQAVHDKLAAGRVNDWPRQGICSALEVQGNRAWYLSNRCEIVCIDTAGFQDEKNDGLTDEQYQGPDKADIVWNYDMIEELSVFPHNLATSSPLVLGDLVLLVSGNGVDEGHLNIPMQSAPSFLAFDKNKGDLVWEFTVHDRVLHGQWSSPSAGSVNGKTLAFFPGGDGWIYALDPKTGEEIWRFNCNPSNSEWELGGYGTKNNLIATPVFADGKVYISVGQDPEHGTGVGHLYCIDAGGKGDVTSTHQVWHRGNEDFGRTMSTATVADGLLYVADLAGMFYCLDVKTGEAVWTREVILRRGGDGKPLEYGAAHVFRRTLTPEALFLIDDGRLPLGTILRVCDCEHTVQPAGFFKIRSTAFFANAFDAGEIPSFYGRRNTLVALDSSPIAEVCEILPPEKKRRKKRGRQ